MLKNQSGRISKQLFTMGLLRVSFVFRPNMAVKGTFCPGALFKLSASSVVSGFCYPYPRAKRPLLLR
jgi:hypothetical protein